MALFNAAYGTPPNFDIRGVEAGNAAELVSRLTNEFAAAMAASETSIVDFKLAGCGSGPQWQAWFVVGTASTPVAALSGLKVVADVAGSPAEALLRLKQRLAAAVSGSTTVFKTVVAGAGDGPTYMAVALFGPTPA